MRPITKGSTDQSVTIRIVDETTGVPETGVVYNTSGIDLWYRREGAAKVSITEATLSALTDAHSDGGILHIGDGYYRLDLPDAAVASGANGVAVGGTVTGMVVIGCYVPLLDVNPYDAVRMGMTALPNANAEASGGLPTLSAAQASNGTINANVHRWLTGTPNALQSGRVDSYLGAVASGVIAAASFAANALDAVWSTATRVLTAGTNIALAKGTGVTGFNDLDAAGVRSAVGLASANLDTQIGTLATASNLATVAGYIDTEVAAIKAKTDNLPASPAATGDIPSAASIADAVWEEAIADHSGTAGSTAEQLAAAGAGGDPWATAVPGSYTSGQAGYVLGNVATGTPPTAAAIADAVWDEALSGHAGAGSAGAAVSDILTDTGTTLQGELDGIQADTEDIQSRLPAALVSGRIDASVGAMASDVVTATALAASAVSEIQSGLSTLDAAGVRTAVGLASANLDTQIGTLATASALSTVAGYIDTEVAAIKAKTDNLPASPAATSDIPSAASIADAVWEEALADHSGTAGSTAEQLAAAGASGDPWATAVPGSYTSGQAGYVLGNVATGTPPTAAAIADAVWDEALAGHAGAGSAGAAVSDILTDTGTTLQGELDGIQADTEDIQSRLPAALVSGRIDASVGAMATDVVTSTALAASAVSEIQSGLSTLDAAGVRTAVGLASANLDTQIGTLATASALSTVAGYIDTEILAIKAKTDNLPSDPADQSAVEAAIAGLLTTQMTESYNADGTAPTLAQALFVIMQRLTEFSISGTTITVKKLDGSTQALTLTLDDATSPTSSTRS